MDGAVTGRWIDVREPTPEGIAAVQSKADETLSRDKYVPYHIKKIREDLKASLDRYNREKIKNLHMQYYRPSPWVGNAAIRFPNYNIADDEPRYFSSGGRIYDRCKK